MSTASGGTAPSRPVASAYPRQCGETAVVQRYLLVCLGHSECWHCYPSHSVVRSDASDCHCADSSETCVLQRMLGVSLSASAGSPQAYQAAAPTRGHNQPLGLVSSALCTRILPHYGCTTHTMAGRGHILPTLGVSCQLFCDLYSGTRI